MMIVALLGTATAIITVMLMRPRAPEPGGPSSDTATEEAMILDSLQATDRRRDWVSALYWAERLGRLRPRDHEVLLARGRAWSNFAVDQRPGRVHSRPALRTSLDRMGALQRAVGLIDSSARLAGQPALWLESGEHIAELYETLALPGDALIVYETIKQRMPDEQAPAMRAYWLRALFYDPVDPDTSAYHQRMKSLGLR